MDEKVIVKPRGGGVEGYQVNARDLESYAEARRQLDAQEIPILIDSKDPHERLFIATLDGTGNSKFDDDPERWTAVARIYTQVEEAKRPNVAAGYVEGTFTQTGLHKLPQRLADGVFGYTFEDRVETAYYQLCVQAKKWITEDPEAKIRVASVGFSRGSEQAAALQRMIDERGIRDPIGAEITRNDEGLIARIEYKNQKLLVEPGGVPQAALLLDAVSTGVREHDRRLPESNLSALHIVAGDEKRDPFDSSQLIVSGSSNGGRDLSFIVAGSHSDIGGTYKAKGLGILNENLGIEYLNRLSSEDFLRKQTLVPEIDQYLIHRSEQHMLGLYTTRGYDKDGVRDTVKDLAPDKFCRQDLKACDVREASDPSLVAKYEFFNKEERLHHYGLVEDKSFERGLNALIERAEARDRPKAKVGDDLDALIERAMQAYGGGDAAAQEHFRGDYNASPQGQRWQQEQDSYGREQRALELQDSWQWKQPEHLKVQQPEAMVR